MSAVSDEAGVRALGTISNAFALLWGCGIAEQASAAATATGATMPDLATCPASDLADEDYRERAAPIPVPPELAALVKSDMDHFAISTLSGSTICVDTGWMEAIDGAKSSFDQRFLSFEWSGYEAFGHIVVDRSGQGQVVETGNAPLAPPSGLRFASIDLSESGFGGFNAFGVWQVETLGLRVLAYVQDGLPAGDWRVTGWSGDACVNISFLPIERQPGDAESFETAARDAWFASEASGWAPAPGVCPKA